MKRRHLTFSAITLTLATLSFSFLASVTATLPYDPWIDFNDDGKIDIKDVAAAAARFGTSGTSLAKAYLAYDSDWVDITDKAGQYFNITHNLNSTDIIVDITGKTTLDRGAHQIHYGLTGYTSGWSKIYGGPSYDANTAMVHTVDGGYVLAGYTSAGAGGWDIWLVKTDWLGNMQWNRTYGTIISEVARSVVQTNDAGYAIAGGRGQDFWLVKTDSNGNHQWNKSYGVYGWDEAFSVIQTNDQGYALVGYTENLGAGNYDWWLVKTDSSGIMQWNQTYGGTDREWVYCLIQTTDGGYAMTGYTNSSGAGYNDWWLVKTDSNGYMEWNKTYGGTNFDQAYCVIQTVDGGYAIIGDTSSFGAGTYDFWLVKTDSNGNHQWNKTYGGTSEDRASSVVQTTDGGYAIGGSTWSFGAGVTDFWFVKTDSSGSMQWSRTYGGKIHEYGGLVAQVRDGGYAIAGWTDSFDAGGSFDFWLVKTEAESGLAWTDSMADTITLYRGATDSCWNYVRVRIWKIKETQ